MVHRGNTGSKNKSIHRLTFVPARYAAERPANPLNGNVTLLEADGEEVRVWCRRESDWVDRESAHASSLTSRRITAGHGEKAEEVEAKQGGRAAVAEVALVCEWQPYEDAESG